MRLSDLPPGVSINDPHINPPAEPAPWRTARKWVLDTLPMHYEETEYRSLLDAIYLAHLPLPISHDDLTGTFVALALLGIRHNMIGERVWWLAMQEAGAVDVPYPFCHGSPTELDCIMAGYCRHDPSCSE